MQKYIKSALIKSIFTATLALAVFSQTPSAMAASLDLYKIGAGDLLEIVVWREDALSRTDLLVRPDGRISLPLVDDILAEGRTPMQVKEVITKELLKYIEAPKVYVTVRNPRSHSFTVIGHAASPGTYPMFRATSILQAIAEAKGFDEWADKSEIKIVRGFGNKTKIYTFDYDKFLEGDPDEKEAIEAQNIMLQPGDVIIVP